MSTNIFGIDFTSGGLKVAVIEKQFRSHKVLKLAHRPLEIDSADQTARVIKETIENLGYDAETDQVIAVFPSDRLTSRVITVPLTKRKMILETLPFELETLLPFEAEDIVSDFLNIKVTDNGSKILAVVAKKDDIEDFLNVYTAAGLDPDMVIPEPVCAGRAAKYKPATENGVDIYINLKENSGSITLVHGHSPVSFHTTSTGIKNGVEPLVSEIKRQMLGDDGEYGPVNALVLSGGPEGLDEMAVTLESTLQSPVRISEMPGGNAPVDSHRFFGRSEANATFALALGAALIVAEDDTDSMLDLRTGQFKRKPRIAGYRTQFITATALFVAGLLVWTISYLSEGVGLNNEYVSLKSEIRSEFKKALPNVKNIVSEEQQLKNALTKLETKAKALGVGAGGVDPLLDFIADITLSVPDDVKLDVEELVYEPDGFIIAGHTESFKKVDKLKKKIEELEWTGKVTVDQAKADVSGGGVRFRLEVKIAI
jgi:general secretion pathway protein L